MTLLTSAEAAGATAVVVAVVTGAAVAAADITHKKAPTNAGLLIDYLLLLLVRTEISGRI
jgi:hypothetical protein